MRLLLAIRCFMKVLFDPDFGGRVKNLAEAGGTPPPEEPPQAQGPAPPASTRNDAIALLATLQREARLVDLVNESLDSYSDAQIGAAAREVLTDSGKVLQRVFAFEPVADVAEGEPMQVPEDYDPGRLRLSGNVSRRPPFEGKLIHSGWVATRCELASWTGSPASALVVAPAVVEVA